MQDFIPPRDLRLEVIKGAADLRASASGIASHMAHMFLSAWATHVVDQWTGDPVEHSQISLTGYELQLLCQALDQSERTFLKTARTALTIAWHKKSGEQSDYPNPPVLRKSYGDTGLYFPSYTPSST